MKDCMTFEWLSRRLLYTILAAIICCGPGNSPFAQNPSPLEKEAQKPVEGSQPASNGSVSTGTPHPAVLDAQHRPITAGGFVSSGPVIFKDIAAEAGLTKWKHTMGT